MDKQRIIRQIISVLQILSVEELMIVLKTAVDIRDYGKTK